MTRLAQLRQRHVHREPVTVLLVSAVLLLLLVPAAWCSDLSDVPGWARHAVWYQIFPERFRNGDPSNDPMVHDILGAYPHESPREWQISKWTGDWYALQPWERADNKGFYFRAQQRRYGGDLQGVLDKLDYLADLGVNAIYFNPLFEAPSLHKYDATMYHHIDNNFGPDPEGDRKIWAEENPADPATWKWTAADKLFLKLLKDAHARGMKVIIDGVFNHVGITYWAFRDVRLNGQRSPYVGWFDIIMWDDPATPRDEFDYRSWYGVRDLPELKKEGGSLAPGPRQHIKAIVQRWMDPNGDGNPEDGIDGWRLDVAEMVPLGFWKEFRTWVRGINPEAYITGEVWWEDFGREKMFNAAPWLQGDAFDAVMNYRWAREACRFFKDKKNKISASEFDRRLAALRNDYRPAVNAVLMNLFGSHDTDRLSSMIVNVDSHFDHAVGVVDDPDYDVRKPNAQERQTQKLMVLFQMTALGAPMVYYGDEVGMWGPDDPDQRKPMLWSDMMYDNEASHPFGKPRPDDANVFDRQLFEYYKTLISIRRSKPVLSEGEMVTLLTDDDRDLFAFARTSPTAGVVVAMNNSWALQEVSIPVPPSFDGLRWAHLLEVGETVCKDGKISLTLPPKSGAILEAGK